VSQKFSLALGLSILLHAVLAAFLLFGDFSSHPKPKPTPTPMEPIQAVVVERSKVAEQVKNIKKKQADDARKLKEYENQVASAKKKRAQEEKRIKDLEKQRKRKEIEKKKADAEAKKSKAKALAAEKDRKKKLAEKKKEEKAAAEAKAKRLKEQKAAKKAEDLRKKKAEDLRKKKAADKKRKEQLAKERAIQDKLLAEQMAEEMASRQQARQQQVMTEIGRYTALIKQTIMRNLITDRSTMEGKSCKLIISLAPSGFVTNVQLGQGNSTVCAASKTAVYKAVNLPVSKDPAVYKEMKTISLTVAPEF
jgi:colicin import membrane protein